MAAPGRDVTARTGPRRRRPLNSGQPLPSYTRGFGCGAAATGAAPPGQPATLGRALRALRALRAVGGGRGVGGPAGVRGVRQSLLQLMTLPRPLCREDGRITADAAAVFTAARARWVISSGVAGTGT